MLVVKTTSPATSPSPAKVQPGKLAPSSRTTSARLRPPLNPCSKPRSHSVVYQLAADHRSHDAALEAPPEVRAVARPAHEGVRPHRPLLGEVREREVRGRPGGDGAGAPDPSPRRRSHRLDEAMEREPVL